MSTIRKDTLLVFKQLFKKNTKLTVKNINKLCKDLELLFACTILV